MFSSKIVANLNIVELYWSVIVYVRRPIAFGVN